jgi:hypothetical protein
MTFKKSIFLLVVAPFLLLSTAKADYYYDCCPPEYCSPEFCAPCSSWVVYGEWLYWRARRCQLDFAFNGEPSGDPDSSTGRVHSVEPCYDHGFRVGFQRYCGDLFFDAFYTYFRNDEKHTVVNIDGLSGTHYLNAVGGSQGFELARGKWDLDLRTVDILAGYQWSRKKCFHPYVFGGFKYASIDQELKSLYSDDVAITGDVYKVKQKIGMCAYGIDLGIGAKYSIFNFFNVFGRVSYDVLLGDFKRRFVYETSADGGATFEQNVNLHDECWYSVSVFNVLFGLGYEHLFNNCWCANLGVSVGYEFHQWINQPDFLEVVADFNDESTVDRHLQSLGFDGLFVRASLGF